MRRFLGVLLALFALIVAGCGEGGGDSNSSASSPQAADTAREADPAEAERYEIVTGSLDLTADDPVHAAREVADLAEAADGRVESLSEQAEVGAVVTVRIPTERLDDVIEEIRKLGKVTDLSTTRDDVTMQYTDLEARTAALRTSVDRLRGLIESSADITELLAAEDALSERQAELDSLEAQRRRMADRIELSTLTVDITTERLRSDQDSFGDGLASGWNGLVSALGAAAVSVGAALPWVAFLIVCAGIVYLIVRLFTRKGRRADSAAEPTTERTENDA